MKRIVILLIIISTISTILWSQDNDDSITPTRNSILFTLGGAGVYTSIVYERELYQLKSVSAGIRAGFGLSPFALTSPEEFNFPVGVYGLYGKNKHHIDFSFSLSNYFMTQYNLSTESDSKEYKILLIPSLGWRFQKPGGGFIIKAGISPLVSLNKIRSNTSPWIEIAAGWAF